MTIQNETLIFSLHHRKCPPFEDTMRDISSLGFNHIWILETGNKSWGSYDGPLEKLIEGPPTNYDMGLVRFKSLSIPEHIKQIVFIDNDCFLLNKQDLVDYLTAYKEQGLQMANISVCHDTPKERKESTDLLLPCNVELFDINLNLPDNELQVGTNPHFENAYMILDKEVWDKLTSKDVSHGKRMWPAIMKQGNIKVGLRRCLYRSSTFIDPGYFCHIGNLMSSYYNVEQGRLPIDEARCGYFIKHFPSRIHVSNPEKCLEAYERLIK